MSETISDASEEKPRDPSYYAKRANPGGGYYTICDDHDTEWSRRSTECACDRHGAIAHPEFGEVAVSRVGHSAREAPETAENGGTKMVTSDVLVVRYTFDAPETLHRLLSKSLIPLEESENYH